MGKREEFGKHKESSGKVWRKAEHGGEIIGEAKYSREKGLQEGGASRKIYSKNII